MVLCSAGLAAALALAGFQVASKDDAAKLLAGVGPVEARDVELELKVVKPERSGRLTLRFLLIGQRAFVPIAIDSTFSIEASVSMRFWSAKGAPLYPEEDYLVADKRLPRSPQPWQSSRMILLRSQQIVGEQRSYTFRSKVAVCRAQASFRQAPIPSTNQGAIGPMTTEIVVRGDDAPRAARQPLPRNPHRALGRLRIPVKAIRFPPESVHAI